MSYRLPAIAELNQDAIARAGVPAVRPVECRVCLGPHEPEIHDATRRVRRWFRGEVTKGFRRRPDA